MLLKEYGDKDDCREHIQDMIINTAVSIHSPSDQSIRLWRLYNFVWPGQPIYAPFKQLTHIKM